MNFSGAFAISAELSNFTCRSERLITSEEDWTSQALFQPASSFSAHNGASAPEPRGSKIYRVNWLTRPAPPDKYNSPISYQCLSQKDWESCLLIFNQAGAKCNQITIWHQAKRHIHVLEDLGNTFIKRRSIFFLWFSWLETIHHWIKIFLASFSDHISAPSF